MKRISVAVAFMAAGTAAMANTGTIQFKGKITDATCAIEVIDPISGSNNSMIQLGTYNKAYFTAANVRTPARPFQLWIKDASKCGLKDGDTVSVIYTGLDGAVGDYFQIKQGTGAAGSVAVALKDRNSGDIKPNTPTITYPITSGENRLNFSASMIATAATVTAGYVDSDIQFVVNLP
ncbi:fimbrial protein [Pseudomonas sp. Marseille-Q5115]|uniref:fimbrial protein n=1 Tax=Pseudomonas sp. Marseille-Q5115 TaxID=2866593 RepID=UPI001CE43985|nr:fimbrial protein [Pseudomonas sp. Marseille-Q5115]